jgi:DNA-binding GntR family transcriptional regulator
MAWGSKDKVLRKEHAACGCQEHRQLLDAIRLRDVKVAQELMVAHLHTIESQLNFSPVTENEFEIEQLLQD